MLFIKRTLDIVFSLLLIILLCPVMLLEALLIKCTVPGDIFFDQVRVGKGKKGFYILKFRTMAERGGKEGQVVGIGWFLRRTKLDELPQLMNILWGDMSFVGPRPYVEDEGLNLPDERYIVRPGLTGLAQVNGNKYLPWDERTAYDIEYVRNLSLGLDLKIILKTFLVVLLGEEKFVHHLEGWENGHVEETDG